jgi:hypothetical protein
MRVHISFHVVAIGIAAALLGASRPAGALTSEIVCQQTIGTSALRFAKRVHLAELHCEDAEASGGTCDQTERDASIADAALKLATHLGNKCGDPIQLETLGFPGLCADANGSPFTSDELDACLETSHEGRIVGAVAIEYPPHPGVLSKSASDCQRKIGNAGLRFIKQKLKYRQRCRNGQLRATIGPGVDCAAEIPPAGPGTGDADTDARIASALAKLTQQLANACEGLALEDVGFPGECVDPDGPPFSLADLEQCIATTHEGIVDELFAYEYPQP